MYRFIVQTRYKPGNLYFKKHYTNNTSLSIDDMPHPDAISNIGTRINLVLNNGTKLHEYIHKRHNQLGPIFFDKLGGDVKMVFTKDPTLMKKLFLSLEGKYPYHILPEPWTLYEKLHGSKRGLFFMNDEEWLTNRRIMNKLLLLDSSEKWLEEPIKTTVKHFVTNWKDKSLNGEITPNLESEFYRLSTDVLITVLLGTNVQCTKINEDLLTVLSEAVKKIFTTTTALCGKPLKICQELNLKVWRNFKESVDDSLFLAQKLVNEILLHRDKTDGLIKKMCDSNVSNETITRIVADFIIAAGDTTAYTSLWIFHLLSKNQNFVDELRMQPDGAKYIVKEAMRLYPVPPFLTRILPRDSIFGKYYLQKGTPVIASIYTSGRDVQNFSDAHKFLPYRWNRNDPRKKHLTNHDSSATLPFALGTRSCIGKKIALIQLSELTRQIVNTFNLKNNNEDHVGAITSQVLIPDKPIHLTLSLHSK